MDSGLEGGLFTMAGAALGPFLTGMLGFAAWRITSRRKLSAALVMLQTELKANLRAIRVAREDPTGRELPELQKSLFEAFGTELLQLRPQTRRVIIEGYDHAFSDRVLVKTDAVTRKPIGQTPFVADAERMTSAAIEVIEVELSLKSWFVRVAWKGARRPALQARVHAQLGP